jgi:hypothetical protein
MEGDCHFRRWTASGPYEFRHRDFVQEIGKECLLP